MTWRGLVKVGGLIATGMIAGRLLGLMREMLLAARFGTGQEADLAVGLLLIPDFIVNLFIATAASAALVPAFAARDEERARVLLWQALVASMLAFTVLALLIFLLFPFTQHAGAFVLALSSLPLTAATSVITAYLQYRSRFLVPAFANVIFNSIVILTLWLLPPALPVLGGGILIGATLRLVAHAGALPRGSLRGHQAPWEIDIPLLKTYAAAVASGMFGLLPQYVPYALIALAGGSVAAFNYAFKLVLLPAILGQAVLQLVLLPWFARLQQADRADMGGAQTLVRQLTWIISFTACLSLSLAAYPLAQLCFGYGRMIEADIAHVAELFAIGVWAMPGILLTTVWQQMFYAAALPRPPLKASTWQAALVIPLCWIGQMLFDTHGVLVAFVLVQTLPIVLLAREGYKRGVIRWGWPSVYASMALVALAVFLPSAWLLEDATLPAGVAVLLAGVIGVVSLGAGLAVHAPIRQWGMQRLRRT